MRITSRQNLLSLELFSTDTPCFQSCSVASPPPATKISTNSNRPKSDQLQILPVLKMLRDRDGKSGVVPSHNTCYPRPALLWDYTQRRMVIAYRRFGKTYRSHLDCLTYQDGTTDRLFRKVGKKLPLYAAQTPT